MSRESTTGVESGADRQPAASTSSTEADWIAETTDPGGEGVSLVDPLLYAPLLLVGAALVVLPEPATSILGIACIAAGVFLAVADLLSADEPV